MLWVPAVRALVAHAAVRVSPLPESATALQPEIELPPSVKLTEPVGLLPVTVAVKVTVDPAVDGLTELASAVDVETLLTVCVSVPLIEAVLVASPL